MRFTFAGSILAAFAVLLPFVTSRHLFDGAINVKIFLIVGIAILAALHFAYLLIIQRHRISLHGRWLLALLGMSVIVLYLTTLFGVYPENSLFSTYIRSTGVLYLTIIALLAWWASEFLTEQDWSLVRRSIAGSAALLAILLFIGSEGLGYHERFGIFNFGIDGFTIGNSTFAGAYLLLAFVITLVEFFRSDSTRAKTMLGAAAAVQFLSPTLFNTKALLGQVPAVELFTNPFALIGTAQASSVTAFMVVAYVAGLLLIRKFVSKNSAANFVWAGAWLISIATLLTLLFVPGSFVQEKFIDRSSVARILVWNGAWEGFQERPLLGWGPENFRFSHELHTDNRLYLKENVGEVWFDRAHNLFFDTLVAVGAFGLLVFAALSLYMILIAVRAARAGVISILEANVIGVLVVGHVLQLQTAFDTVTTYALMALMLGYVLMLERKLVPSTSIRREWFLKGLAVVLAALAIAGSVYLIDEYSRQKGFYRIFVPGQTKEQQIEHIHAGMRRTNDFEALRLGSASLARGLFGELSAEEKKKNAHIIRGSVEQLAIFGEYWQKHLEQQPDDYRARMNYAYQLLIRTVFGEGEYFDEAQAIIQDSYRLSPGNPLTYVLDGLTLLYQGNVVAAQEKMNEALAQNPDIPFSQNMVKYVNEQAASFPEITVIKLQNL